MLHIKYIRMKEDMYSEFTIYSNIQLEKQSNKAFYNTKKLSKNNQKIRELPFNIKGEEVWCFV